MRYQIVYAPGTEKQLKRLQPTLRAKIVGAISSLAENPRPNGCRKLKNREDQYRIRIGDYRVIYSIHDKIVTVTIMKIDHRREIYR